MKIKPLKKKYINFLIFFVLLIFVFQKNFIVKTYKIINENYDKRLISIYGYCEKEAAGFVYELKKKYNFKKNPKIINFEVYPNSSWLLHDTYKTKDDSQLVLLNYSKELALNFFLTENLIFKNKAHVQYSQGIDTILFDINSPLFIDTEILIYKKNYDGTKEILKFKINRYFKIGDNYKLDFKTNELNSRWEKIYIEIKNKELIKNINTVQLKLKHKYPLEKYNIIENYQNTKNLKSCLYVTK